MGESKVIIIKKRAKGHAQHGGAWKVAYADFVTAMMALFIVLWLVSQTDQETRQRLSEYFRTGMFSGAPALVMGGSGVNEKGFLDGKNGALELEYNSFKNSAINIEKSLRAAAAQRPELKKLHDQVEVTVTEQGLLIQIVDGNEDLLFDLSSAELKPELRALLETIAPPLAELDTPLQVHGYTDARPFPAGAARTNWDLSFARADNARRVLQVSGIREGQVTGVFAHADTDPRVPTDPFASENRRLTILAPSQAALRGKTHGSAPPGQAVKPTAAPVPRAAAKPKESTL